MVDDLHWMRRAIRIARQGWGRTHPNPVVGAVLASEGELLAEGFHACAGKPHAEVDALSKWEGEIPESATLYITLEPCSTFGKTPPCTELILSRGVRRVVVGATDNDARHGGRGITLLRERGVEVVSGVLDDECRDLNLIFHHLAASGEPLIAAKFATTIDGRIATASGASKWITGEESRQDVHRWRRYFPAIAVGAGTVLADDPSLTARFDSDVFCPSRLIFDRSGLLAKCPVRRVFTDEFSERTVVLTSPAKRDSLISALPSPGRVITLEPGQGWISSLRAWLKKEKIGGVYVEGGRGLLSELFEAHGVDYLFAYRAPRLFLDDRAVAPAAGLRPTDPSDGIRLVDVRHETFGADELMRGFVAKNPAEPPS